jgi:di/tricarboxylate transporter
MPFAVLMSWARRCGVPPKKLLIPLSYAAVLGGTCTSIGTSTNLVIVGMQDTRYTKQARAFAAQGCRGCLTLLPATHTHFLTAPLASAAHAHLQKNDDEAKFGMFDIAPYGVPYALMGFVFIILTQRFLRGSSRTQACAHRPASALRGCGVPGP